MKDRLDIDRQTAYLIKVTADNIREFILDGINPTNTDTVKKAALQCAKSMTLKLIWELDRVLPQENIIDIRKYTQDNDP